MDAGNNIPPAATSTKSQTGPEWFWLAIVVVVLVVQVKWWWFPSRDAACYLSIAKNMSAGQLENLGSPHVRYAPGYPLLIAPAFWTSDAPFLAISLIHLALAMLLAGGIWLWMRRLAPQVAGPLTALVFVNASFCAHYRMVHSEVAMMTELVWGTLALSKALESPTLRQALGWAFLAVPLIVLASLTRHAASLILAGFAVALLLKVWRDREQWLKMAVVGSAVAVPVTVAVLGLVVWDRSRADGRDTNGKIYYECLDDPDISLASQVVEGFRLRISECGRLVIPGMYKAYARTGDWLNVNVILYICTTTLLVFGWWRLVRGTIDPLLLAVPFYTGLYVVWPFDQGTRFMLPLLPVLCLSVWKLIEKYPLRDRILMSLVAMHAAVAMGVWVRDIHKHDWVDDWQALAVLTNQLEEPPEEIGVLANAEGPAEMVRVQLDENVEQYTESESIPDSVRWLVAAQNSVPGFTAYRSQGRFYLMHRGNAVRVASQQ